MAHKRGHDTPNTDHTFFQIIGALASIGGVLLTLSYLLDVASLGSLGLGIAGILTGLPFLLWGKRAFDDWKWRALTTLAIILLAIASIYNGFNALLTLR